MISLIILIVSLAYHTFTEQWLIANMGSLVLLLLIEGIIELFIFGYYLNKKDDKKGKGDK